MDSWSKLTTQCAQSEDLAELADDHPRAFILFTYMIAAARVWGRFPASPRVLKSVVCPMLESMTVETTAEALTELERRGMVTRYPDDDGADCLAVTNHHKHNPTHNWARCGDPKYPHPPGWEIPDSLRDYLAKVRDGKYLTRDKQPVSLADECRRLRLALSPDGTVTVASHSDSLTETTHTAGQALKPPENREQRTEESPPTPPLGGLGSNDATNVLADEEAGPPPPRRWRQHEYDPTYAETHYPGPHTVEYRLVEQRYHNGSKTELAKVLNAIERYSVDEDTQAAIGAHSPAHAVRILCGHIAGAEKGKYPLSDSGILVAQVVRDIKRENAEVDKLDATAAAAWEAANA